jgi:hypothetical protein
MKMPLSVAAGVQFSVMLFSHDCYNALSFISGLDRCLDAQGNFRERRDQRGRWQLAVDTVYRLLVCGLIEQPFAKTAGRYVESVHGSYFAFLASTNPFGPDMLCNLWFDDLCATLLCDEMIALHELQGRPKGTLCEPFIAELEALFDSHGVGWSDDPLVPISAV